MVECLSTRNDLVGGKKVVVPVTLSFGIMEPHYNMHPMINTYTHIYTLASVCIYLKLCFNMFPISVNVWTWQKLSSFTPWVLFSPNGVNGHSLVLCRRREVEGLLYHVMWLLPSWARLEPNYGRCCGSTDRYVHGFACVDFACVCEQWVGESVSLK